MLILIVIAPIFAILISLASRAVVRLLAGRFGADRNSKVIGCGVPLFVFMACMVFFVWLPSAMTHSGLGVTPQVANGRLLTFKIPKNATNVDFRHAYFNGLTDAAEFDIDETEFLKWMATNNRTPARFVTVDDYNLEWDEEQRLYPHDRIEVIQISAMLQGDYSDRIIQKGHYFDDYDRSEFDDSGITIVYDLDSGRAYVWQTTY